MSSTPSTRGADLALLLVVVIWGLNFTLMKSALAVTDPWAFNLARLAVATLTMALMMRPPADGAAPPPLPWRKLVPVGLLGNGVYQCAFVAGLERTTSGSSALLIASAPLWTALFGRLLGIERLSARAAFGLAVAFAGAMLVAIGGGGSLVDGPLLGNAITLVGAFGWGLYTVLLRPLLREVSPTRLAFWTMLVSMPVHVVLGAEQAVTLLDAPLWVWGAIVYAGAMSTGVAYVLWNIGVQRVGASQTAVYAFAVPVLAVTLGALVLDEPIFLQQAVGGVAILAGVLLVRRRSG